MGYVLSIQRNENKPRITLEEWKEYLKNAPDFDAIEEYSTKIGEETITISTPNAGLWNYDNVKVPFTFSDRYGWISVKNPNYTVIEKMIQIANEVNAVVLGEEDEVYNEDYLKENERDLVQELNEWTHNPSNINKKKWWEFWK